jgi:hypothetical protein
VKVLGFLWFRLTSVTSDSLTKRKPLRYREIEHGNLDWALDDFLVIKVEDPTLVILASKLKGETSSCPWIASYQVILMIHPCKREDLS